MGIPVLFGRTLRIPRGCWRGPGGTRNGVAYFSFEELCSSTLGTTDYAALASKFSVLFLDGIPQMETATRAEARRFIVLIDELYNRRVRLICSAATDIDDLFAGVELKTNTDLMEQMEFETEMPITRAASTSRRNCRSPPPIDQ